MKNKFFSIITALLLTLALVSPNTLAIDTATIKSDISTCAVETEDDVLDYEKDPFTD